MCNSCDIKISDVWLRLSAGQGYRTPDHAHGVMFNIFHATQEHVSIAPQDIQVNRVCFADALHYLRENHHYSSNPCAIGSNDDPQLAGPLCLAARNRNHNQLRCINYILPILQNHGLVGVGCNQPNTTWFVSR